MTGPVDSDSVVTVVNCQKHGDCTVDQLCSHHAADSCQQWLYRHCPVTLRSSWLMEYEFRGVAAPMGKLHCRKYKFLGSQVDQSACSHSCRCCYFQTPSVVHCMNATASAQSPKFLRNFYPQTIFANFCGHRASAVALLRVTGKRSCTFGMINRERLELATSPIGNL